MGFYSKPKDKPSGLSYDPLPPTWYTADIDAVDIKTSKAGQEYLNLHWRIVEGEHNGRIVFEMVCTEDDGSKWAQMGQETLYQICDASGVEDLESPRDMIGLRCDIKLGIERSDEYDDRNTVKRHRAPVGGRAPAIPMPDRDKRFDDDNIPF